MNIIAWTGGSRPYPLRDIGSTENGIVLHLFRKNVRLYAMYWGGCELEICRTIWRRARYDAHATIREAIRSGAERVEA